MLMATGAFASPNRTTYQARIVKPDGYPLEVNNVNFNFTILDPTGSCVIYMESYSAVNMANSGGLISFSLGSGTRTYPASATTFASVFDNSTVSYSCQTPGIFSPVSTDIRKIVMQFNDGAGWQTLPAMSINAVPYAMYAGKAENAITFNGKADTSFVEYSSIPTCVASQALHFNGATFQCVAGGGGGASSTVTSGDITTALGYTPANPANIATSFTTVTSSLSSANSSISSLTSSYTALASSLIATINGSSSSTQIFSLGVSGVSPSIQTSNGVHTFNLPLAASASVTAGLLSNADFVTFSGKMNATSAAIIAALGYAPVSPASLTTTNANLNAVSSAVSSLAISTAASFAAISDSGISTFNGSTSATQSLNNSLTGTQPAFLTAAGVHTLNIPYASVGATTAGLLSNADYVYFSNKLASSTAAIAQVLGYIPAASGSFSISSSSISSALGYTPADATSVTTVISNLNTVSSTVTTLSNTKITSSAASIAQVLGYTPAASGAATSSQWTTSGTNIFYNNGNVGIGTNSPLAGLHVSKDIGIGFAAVFQASDVNGFTMLGSSAASGGAVQGLDASGAAGILSLNRIGGNVGIGTITPNAKLTVKGSGTGVVDIGEWISGATYGAIYLNGSYSVSGAYNLLSSPGDPTLYVNRATGNDIKFRENNSDQMVIKSGGNIGIGTSAPTAVLHLKAGTTSIAPLKFSSGTLLTSPQSGSIEYDGFNFYTTNGAGTRAAIATGSDGSSTFAASGTTAIFNSGNVGVGTSNPVRRLDVYAASGSSAPMSIRTNDYAAGSTGSALFFDFGAVSGNTYSSLSAASGGGVNANNLVLNPTGGNVGIGVTAPTAKLHVNGDIRNNFVSQTVYTNNLSILSSSADMAINYSSAILNFNSDTTSAVTFTRAGRVGIGTSSPVAALTVNAAKYDSSFPFNAFLKDTAPVAAGVGGGIGFGGYVNATTNDIAFGGVRAGKDNSTQNDVAGYLSLFYRTTSSSGLSEGLRISSSGNVGIGTSAPTRKLTVADSTSPSFEFNYNSGAHTLYGGADFNQPWFGTSTNSDLRLITSSTEKVRVTAAGFVGIGKTIPTSNLHIDTGISSTNYTGIKLENAFKTWTIGNNVPNNYNNIFGIFDGTTPRLWIGDTGHVGLGGVINPTQKLHVSGSVQVDGDIYGGKYGGTRGIWRFSTTDPNFGIFYTEANPDIISFSPNGGGSATAAMSIVGNNVGIGTSNPTYTLQLALDSAAKPGTSAWTIASDRRLKDYHGDFKRGLAAMEEIQPVYFNYKKDNVLSLPSEKKYVGIFAQDVKKTIPEAIHQDPDGYLKVTNDSIFWTMFNAIKELYHKWSDDSQVLHREIASVKAENAAKDQKIKELEERLQKIESALQKK